MKMPLFNKILLALFFVWLLAVAFTPERDGDLWFNLKSGEVIVQTGHVFDQDIFSFTHEGEPWINRLWLFQVLLYVVFTLFSWHGIIIMKCVFILFTFHFLLSRYYKSENLGFILIVAALGALAMQFRMLIRPELTSFLFLALNFYLLDQYKTNYDRTFLLPLPLLKMVWMNMHGLFVLGFVLDAACIAEIGLRSVIGKMKDLSGKRPAFSVKFITPSYKMFLTFLVIEIVSVAGLFVNPFGWRGVAVPFEQWRMIGEQSFFLNIHELLPTMTYFLREGMSPGFLAAFGLISIATILLIYETLRTRALPVFYGAVFLVFCYLGFKINRNLALWSIMTVAISASIAGGIKVSQKYRVPYKALCLIILLVLFAGRLGETFTTPWTSESSLSQGTTPYLRSPEKVVDFLIEHDITGRIYSNMMLFENYYLWRLGPEKKVFWDGRLEVYGEEFYRDAITSVRSREAFQQFIANNEFDCLVFAYRSTYESDQDQRMLKRMTELYAAGDWKLVYLDSYYCVFVASRFMREKHAAVLPLALPETAEEAKAFTAALPWHTVEGDIDGRIYEYYSIAKIANLFGKSALADHVIDLAIKANPEHPYALLLAARREFAAGNYVRAHELYEKALPSNPQVVLLLAETSFKLKRYEESIYYLKQFIGRYPYNTSAYLRLADNYFALEDLAHAKTALEVVLRHDAHNPTARRNYALLMAKMKG
jgi:tetratricopeptide (TPR) repeat protein